MKRPSAIAPAPHSGARHHDALDTVWTWDYCRVLDTNSHSENSFLDGRTMTSW
jgi:hypothetical protein